MTEAINEPVGDAGWRGLIGRLHDRRVLVPLCLALILLLGAYFRFTGVNWDDDTHLHPDERHIWMVTISLSLPRSLGQYFDTATSPLNPYNKGSSFIYGTVPLFLTKWLGEMLDLGGPDSIHLLGRVLAGLSDLLSVVLIFFIGRKLYDERVGLLSAFLTACLVIHIQQSHFYTADSFVATFVLLTFYRAIFVVQRGRWSDFAWMGVSYGLAVASKINVALFGAVMALACLLRIHRAVTQEGEDAPEATDCRQADARPAGRDRTWQRRFGTLDLSLSIEGADADGIAPPAPVAVVPIMSESATASVERDWIQIGLRVALQFAFCLGLAFLTFRIAQPYSFQGPGFFDMKLSQAWLNDVRYWAKAAAGEVDLPFNHQWTSRAPILFSLQNMVLWAVGVPLGLASWAGWAFAWYELLRKRQLGHALVLSWTTFFFLYQSTRFGKLSRYLTPFFPLMAMLAGYLLVVVWDRVRPMRTRWLRTATVALAAIVLVGTLLWAFAFTRIYTRPLTRVQASLWVYDNIPPGSAIGNEHWDDAIPWGGVGGRNGYADGTYEYVEFHPYAEDEPIKLEWFMDWLGQADYIILSSNRLYGSIPRLPMRFPMTTRYYKYLFNGELGFDLIRTFTSRPNLGPIEFNDDNAEEPFTVYDHPRVDVFAKSDRFDLEKARGLLGDGIDWDGIARLMPIEVPGFNNGLQMTEEEAQVQRAGGTWARTFDRNSLSNAVPVLMWLLMVEMLGLVAWPIADRLFRTLPDRGYILSKTLGILLWVWLTWMGVNLGLFRFTRTGMGVVLLALSAVSGCLLWLRREEFLSFWRSQKRLVLVNEALFLGFFVVFLLIRYGNPDLWHPGMGGEKPMDLAYLNAVIKSSIFPPYDPWYAGGYLNYYYFGQIIVGSLIKFTGIVPWVAYNLAIPLLAALTAMGAFSVGYNLTHKPARPDWGWWRRAFTWGLAAALMVAVLGNLGEIGVWFKALKELGTVEARSSLPYVADVARVLSGLLRWLSGDAKPNIRPEWPYWDPSRIMSHGEINEFPFFTFLYADLHAHLIGLPFTLLALGIALAVLRRGAGRMWRGIGPALQAQDWRSRVRHAWEVVCRAVNWDEVLALGALGLAIGALRPINSWDYPTYLVVAVLALALRQYEARHQIDLRWLLSVGWRAAVVFVLSNLFFQPFLSRFSTAYTSIERWRGIRTGLGAYLVIHGLFLWIVVSWLLVKLFGRGQRGGSLRLFRLMLRHWDRVPRLLGLYRTLVHTGREMDRPLWLLGSLVAALAALLALLGEWFTLFVLLLALGTLLVLLRWQMDPQRRFVWLLFGLGLGLSLVVDWVVLKGDIGRMNTVFKFYLQIWVLWSVVAAVAMSRLFDHLPGWPATRRRWWLGVLGLLVFLCALYPVVATRAKVRDRFDPSIGPTLDGMAFMETAVYYDGQPIELKWDYDAIQWLLDNVEGSPVVAEANTEPRGLYRWGSRVANYTGLPTIIGWSWHQRQQRSAMPDQWISRRLDDVWNLFADPSISVAKELLAKYDVSYIYVGDVERAYYPTEGLEKFERMRADGDLQLAYHNDHVRIYEVVHAS